MAVAGIPAGGAARSRAAAVRLARAVAVAAGRSRVPPGVSGRVAVSICAIVWAVTRLEGERIGHGF